MNEIFVILDNSYSFVNLIFEDYKNEFTLYFGYFRQFYIYK